ncbi:MAG TPA: GTPase, partial [Cytophagales bacterium]|nr:GTPase [Cytophagales bacterium]
DSLVNLTSLDLSNNQLTRLGGLDALVNLTELKLRNNQLTLLGGLEGLVSLTSLYLRENELTTLGGLEGLGNLTSLYLDSNQLTSLAGLEPLVGLTRVDAEYNQLATLPAWIVDRKFQVNYGAFEDGKLCLRGNPLTAPPIEIVKQGHQAVVDWFDANKKELNEIKVILLGDPKAGKTSMLRRLSQGDFNPQEPQTDGINIESLAFGGIRSFKTNRS